MKRRKSPSTTFASGTGSPVISTDRKPDDSPSSPVASHSASAQAICSEKGTDMQNSDIRFAVIIPLFNKGPHVLRAIESVLCQKLQPSEIIVVDDGSTDEGPEIIKAFQDARIKLFCRGAHGPGGYAARNFGIEKAQSEWVAFLDADDAWKETHLYNMRELIALYGTNIGCVFTSYDMVDPSGRTRTKKIRKFAGETAPRLVTYQEFLDAWIADKDSPIWTGAVAFRRKVLIEAGLFPDGLCKRGGDKDLWLRTMSITTAAFSPVASAIYYRDATNMVTATAKIDSPHMVTRRIAEWFQKGGFTERRRLQELSNIETVNYSLMAMRQGVLPRRIFDRFYKARSPFLFLIISITSRLPPFPMRWSGRYMQRMWNR